MQYECGTRISWLKYNNLTCPFKSDRVSEGFHTKADWERVTYAVKTQHVNENHTLKQ